MKKPQTLFSFGTQIAFAAVCFLAIASCGGDDSSDSDISYLQDVRQISFRLSELDLHITSDFPAGGHEDLDKSLHYLPDDSKDHIQRVIKDGAFVLMVNNKQAGVLVSANGSMDHTQNAEESIPGCDLHGQSHVSGKASNSHFELDWDLDADLSGDGCDAGMKAKFLGFQNAEADSLNLQAIRDLLNASDKPRDQIKHMHLQLKVFGDGT